MSAQTPVYAGCPPWPGGRPIRKPTAASLHLRYLRSDQGAEVGGYGHRAYGPDSWYGSVCACGIGGKPPLAKRRPRDARIAQQAMSATVAELACIKSCKDSSIWSPILPPEHIIASSKRSAVSSMKVGKCFFMPNGLQPPWT